MDATPIVKRRKLNQAVNKPFKSPLKTARDQSAPTVQGSPLASTPIKNASSDDVNTPADLGFKTPATRAIHLGSRSTPLRQRLSTTISNKQQQSSTTNLGDPAIEQEIQNTIRPIRSLESSLTKQRQDIDTLNQALRLLSSNKSEELDELTIKWRTAARQAAEEVFSTARDKVNRMGGVGAWREMQKERVANNQWDDPVDQHLTMEEEIYDDEGELVEVRVVERQPEILDEWEYDEQVEEEAKVDEGKDDDVSLLLIDGVETC